MSNICRSISADPPPGECQNVSLQGMISLASSGGGIGDCINVEFLNDFESFWMCKCFNDFNVTVQSLLKEPSAKGGGNSYRHRRWTGFVSNG